MASNAASNTGPSAASHFPDLHMMRFLREIFRMEAAPAFPGHGRAVRDEKSKPEETTGLLPMRRIARQKTYRSQKFKFSFFLLFPGVPWRPLRFMRFKILMYPIAAARITTPV